MSNNTQPEIRFPGFTEDWEERKLNELAEFNPKSDLPERFEYVDLESVVGTELVGHRTENRYSAPSRAQRLAKKNDVFYQTVRPYQKNNYLFDLPYDNYVFSTGYAQMRPIGNGYFLLTLIQEEKFVNRVLERSTGTSYPAINSNDLAKLPVKVPADIQEQQKVGTFFKQIDNTITLHQRKLDLLKETKKGFLQKMFPKNGAKVPEVRFPGFTEDWEERKFGLLFEKNLEKNKNSEFDASRTISIATMHFKEEGNGAAESSLATYKVLRVGDIAYEGHTSKQFAFGRFVLNDIGDGIMSPRFTTLRPTSERPISFWKQYIHYEPIMRHLLVRSTKNGTMMNELVIPDLEKESLLVPSESEQKQIGEFFDKLDETITLHQRKLDLLKETKKGFLQKMFV
ncbi:TPA: restriction endonuclease subunit S [Enterococcus faecium]|uniref:restriction endonuclease subunit S n=1 Tax=Enterococcus faecium TaxID=1352 RepID=UPI000F6452C7|nr:restriction endonuclease subunit S [Enterococcus faecium]RRQ56177.1 restriction endonuclease subunit S [Enterococcus faecium]